ncbi:hypothetical protein F5B22DRAFT_377889 [Xylaria bambusicola]|uniref:uncharacterized protein n=1 Tax=Xylaria bambusicola TaxID=326684 RepID=UPI0020087F51|nr:uncharacterized protein F5B22DRAFT_377889 [Xylaria bambusicola]KAI0508849.1 hypothetical protein F5B22DRAFT_377889 [Xylaria bambusicola]
MYRAALRSAPRTIGPLRQSSRTPAASGRRFASTAPADKRRTWKSSAVRWGLAVGAVYYYSTSNVFAEEPKLATVQPPPEFSDEDLPTIEAVVAQKRREAEARSRKAAAAAAAAPESKTSPEPETAALASQTSPEAPAKELDGNVSPAPEDGSPEALEQEAAQQGAFNPETGEINWDCPCLGGMADGPCGEQFKAAFSCFVYSQEEPKGMDCIDKFQHMQDCFRLHPEVYGDELADDEEAGAATADGAPTDTVAARDVSAESASVANAAPTEPASKSVAPTTKETTKTDAKISATKPEAVEQVTPSPSKSAKKDPWSNAE